MSGSEAIVLTRRDYQSNFSATAAGRLAARRQEVATAWAMLLDSIWGPESRCWMTPDRLERCVAAFTAGLSDADLPTACWAGAIAAPEQVAEVATAMGLFVEAIRRGTDVGRQHDSDAASLMAAAFHFTRAATQAALGAPAMVGPTAAPNGHRPDPEVVRARRSNAIGVLSDIARAMRAAGDIEALFEQVHTACRQMIDGADFSIALYDPDAGTVVPRLVYRSGERRRDLEGRPTSHSLGGVVAETQQLLVVADYAEACAERQLLPEPEVFGSGRLGWMAAPMVVGGRSAGVISAVCPRGPFTTLEADLLYGIAQHAAAALENSRLLEAHHQRLRQLKAVNRFGRQIAGQPDAESVLTTAVELTRELVGSGVVSLFLVEEGSGDLLLRAQACPDSAAHPLGMRIRRTPPSTVARAADSGQAVRVGEAAGHCCSVADPRTQATRSEVAVPILRDDQLFGVLDVQSPVPKAFDEHDITTLRTIADQIALALDNARLLAAERERSRALALMLSTTQAAGSSLVLDEVLQRVAEGLGAAAGVSDCAIYLLDEDAAALQPAVAVAGPDSTVPRDRLLRAPRALEEMLLARWALVCAEPCGAGCSWEPTLVDAATLGLPTGSTALAVPLVTKGRLLGAALVIGSDPAGFRSERLELIRGVADSAALAVENARLYARAHGLAIAEERGRLAQEIHDTLAQGLAAISLRLDLADAHLATKPELAAEAVRRALDLTRQNLEDARRSVLDLRAAHLHRLSLPDGLRRLASALASETGAAVDFAADGPIGRLSARVEIGLFRIAEEALSNVRQHASAGRVRVALMASGDAVVLTIEDDGSGFDWQARSRAGGPGFGLLGMRERARLLRGALTIRSTLGQGTHLQVRVPYERAPVVAVAGGEAIA
ncbi:MAG TPA: GAF domain-containing protein [Thermomicrobiaceae bacterium]|nr:GAF domain-containing protein [Thermomicrobiaceae bacterium]